MYADTDAYSTPYCVWCGVQFVALVASYNFDVHVNADTCLAKPCFKMMGILYTEVFVIWLCEN